MAMNNSEGRRVSHKGTMSAEIHGGETKPTQSLRGIFHRSDEF